MNTQQRWFLTGLFAVAMGYLEAAVVYYLRSYVDRIQPYQANPLPDVEGFAAAELFREAATMVMIFTVGALAGKTWRGRFGYSLFIFGIWDISYYIFLHPLTGWPVSLTDWDILFLIPLPWWGPIWAPTSIAVLMILFGMLATLLELGEPPLWPGKLSGTLCASGITLGLCVFMLDAFGAASGGIEALRKVLPTEFAWKSFVLAWFLMSLPVIEMIVSLWNRYRSFSGSTLEDRTVSARVSSRCPIKL